MKLACRAKELSDAANRLAPAYKSNNREFVVISSARIPTFCAGGPEPLEVRATRSTTEFIRMPDPRVLAIIRRPARSFPVRFRAPMDVQEGGYVHAMYLDDNSPIAGGREIWGFPKKLPRQRSTHESETLVCTLHYGSVLCVSPPMGYKHHELDPAPLLKSLAKPSFMVQDHSRMWIARQDLRAVRYVSGGGRFEGAWSGPAAIELFEHAMCDVPACPCTASFPPAICHRPDAWPRRGGA